LFSTENKKNINGYDQAIINFLNEKDISIGDTVNLIMHGDNNDNNEYTGILMPRYESSNKNHLVIKLKSGYNIGIDISNITSITKKIILQQQQQQQQLSRKNDSAYSSSSSNIIILDKSKQESDGDPLNNNKSIPRVALISTGGTIASKVDYRTGGVHAALSAADLYTSVPELAKYAIIDSEVLLSEYSENLKPEHWTLIVNKISEKVRSGLYHGIIVSHGTDTMHYTASALSFALQNIPIPVVLVGAQRSSDRPSSDAALNLIGATIFATKSEYSGVFIIMHYSLSDDIIACHLGTRVRKNHTSRRNAFESIDAMPIALIKDNILEMHLKQQPRIKLQNRNNNDNNARTSFLVRPNFDNRVILLKYYPGFNPDLIDHAIVMGYKAIVIEGTGLGHINRECFSKIQKAIQFGIMVFMTSQCIRGRVRMTVYDTGRDLLNLGVIPLSDMTSETALVKAMWMLANSTNIEYIKKMMQENIANEISPVIPITD
jgi:glutamyl-tRNA(Gln) amidotransferase subunit D